MGLPTFLYLFGFTVTPSPQPLSTSPLLSTESSSLNQFLECSSQNLVPANPPRLKLDLEANTPQTSYPAACYHSTPTGVMLELIRFTLYNPVKETVLASLTYLYPYAGAKVDVIVDAASTKPTAASLSPWWIIDCVGMSHPRSVLLCPSSAVRQLPELLVTLCLHRLL